MATRKTRQKNTSGADPVTAWAESVIVGITVAGQFVRGAAARHLRDLEDGPKRGLVWNLAAALDAINFFRDVLRLNGGQFEGRPFNLHPSQVFRVGSLFGWKRADGTRRFRRFYDEEAKGNGKSPLLAGIGLYGLVADGESRAEVYAAASKKDQAMVLFRDAVAMVDQSPALASRIKKSGGNPVWNLSYLETGSWFRPISSDDGQSGPRPHFALCDEVHEHHDRNTIDMLERGFKWRRQPLLAMATNSGSDRGTICWEEHDHAVKVALGQIEDDSTFAFVCALDEGDDPLADSSCWQKANPLLGVTVTEEYLRSVVAQAKAQPGKQNGILRLHFCVWTDAVTAMFKGEAVERAFADFDPPEHFGKEITVGLDLSGSRDLTAMAFVVETGSKRVERVNKDGSVTVLSAPTYDAWIEAWTPGDTIQERADSDKADYPLWVKQGHLNAPPGETIRLDYPAAKLSDVANEYSVSLVAYDRYAFQKFEDECDALGLTLPFAEHPQGGKRRGKVPEEFRSKFEDGQGLWMPGSIMEFESMIYEGRIRLKPNPALFFAIKSCAEKSDPWGNRWASKAASVNRIDPAIALFMAIGAATLRMVAQISVFDVLARDNGALPSAEPEQFYEEEDAY